MRAILGVLISADINIYIYTYVYIYIYIYIILYTYAHPPSPPMIQLLVGLYIYIHICLERVLADLRFRFFWGRLGSKWSLGVGVMATCRVHLWLREYGGKTLDLNSLVLASREFRV